MRFLFFLILFIQTAVAEYIPCLDVLAGAQYKKEILESVSNDVVIGLFDHTFGDSFPVAKAFLEQGGRGVRTNFLWSDNHEYGDKDIGRITKIADKYEPLCRRFPGKVEVVPFTEHNLKNPDKYLHIVQKRAPSCTVVNTPWKGAFSKEFKNEIHGDHKKPNGRYNYSFDGTNSVDEDVEKYKKEHSNADIFCVWHPRFNLRYRMKDGASRPQRIKEAKDRKPTKDFIHSMEYLFTSKGNTSIPKNWLPKSHAEKHDANDKKGDKLLIISPIKTGKIILKDNDSKMTFKLPYYGPFAGGGYRYYANDFGFKYGPNLEVWANNKKYGVINGGFRDGSFR